MKTSDYTEDFVKWCADCVTVTDKLTGRPVPLTLNAPQRRVLAVMEERRRRGLPVRLILLKARQWGGSTLVLAYMAWMQLVRDEGRNSVICAHVKDAAANIRGMYSRLLRSYPEALKTPEPKAWALTPYEKSQGTSYLPARDCCLTIATSVAPDSVRGLNFSLAHLSEVAFWGDGDKNAARRIVRTVCGSVPLAPDTLVVMESTANGRDNFFYDEWQRAERGESDKTPVFVPWHEIEIYRRPVADGEREELLASLDDYERRLLDDEGLPLEAVAWYHDKRREYSTHEQMMAEYPGSPEEAFASSGRPLLEADELPGEAGSDTVAAWGVVVFMPGTGDDRHLVVSMGADSGGRIVHLHTDSAEGRDFDAAALAARTARAYGWPLLCLEAADAEGLSHRRSCSRALDRAGADILYSPEGSDFWQATAQTAADFLDRWRELGRRGLVADAEEDARTRFASLRYPVALLLRTDGYSRRALCKMAGAYALAEHTGCPRPSFTDLI